MILRSFIWQYVRSHTFLDPPRHVLICCAHSDDCVIMGAEYAYFAVQNGLSARIVYLTCNGLSPDSAISRTRRAEAIAAWLSINVPSENLVFIDLAASPIEGPVSYSDTEIEFARQSIQSTIFKLPPNSALIIPAEGESHIDHRTVRDISLLAMAATKRDDLIVYETPQYNNHLSVTRAPRRSIRTIVRQIPAMNRIIKPYEGSANFANGKSGATFKNSPDLLEKKKELLKFFLSQDPNLLLTFFGYPTRYRRMEQVKKPSSGLRINAFGSCCDMSVIGFAFAILALIFVICFGVAKTLHTTLPASIHVDAFLLLLAATVGSFYSIRLMLGKASFESSLFAISGALGTILGTS